MTYKYEASIKEAINVEYHADFSGYMNRIKELEETYDKARKYDDIEFKARAFDEIVRCVEYQQAYDLTDSMVMQDIDYAIRKLFTEVEQ